MPEPLSENPPRLVYDWAVIRVVPRIERGEFVNAGIVLACHSSRYLKARTYLDETRLRALDPDADCESIRAYLGAIVRICDGGADSGPIGALPQRERFRWLAAPRSTMLQLSPVHTGACDDLETVLENLLREMVVRR